MRPRSKRCSTPRRCARWTRMRLATSIETRPEAEEAPVDQAPEVDEPAPKKRKQGRQKGYNTPKAEIERQEQIKEAMEYRLMGYTYRQIAEQMEVAPSTAYKWVAEGLADITQETGEELRRVMMEQCHQIIQKLMPLMDETAPGDVLDGILKGPGTADEAGWHAPGRRLLAQHRQAGLWRQRGRYYRAHQGRRARAETRRTGARAASAS